MAIDPSLLNGINTLTGMGGFSGASVGQNGSYTGAASPAYLQPVVGTTQQAPAGDSAAGAATTGQYSTGTGTGTYDPNTDPNLVGQARNQVYGDQNSLNSLYAAINGELGNYANQYRGQVDNQYNTAFGNNDKSYNNAINSQNQMYAARGAYDSSYRTNDNNALTDQYNTSNQDLLNQRNNAYGQIGSTINGVQSQLDNKPQYDLSQYGDVNALTNLHNQLGSYISSLQKTQTDLTPQGTLVAKLNQVAPIQSGLGSALAQQLASLASGTAPSAAKAALANGIIARAQDPNDQQALQQYWQGIINPASATTPSQLNAQLQGA